MWLWRRGRGAQAGQVGGEQAAARLIPARIRPSRLGEHRTEYDDVLRGDVLPDGAVRPPAVDDLPQDPVDLLAHIRLVVDTYTILVTGHYTAGRYTLLNIHVPPAG